MKYLPRRPSARVSRRLSAPLHPAAVALAWSVVVVLLGVGFALAV